MELEDNFKDALENRRIAPTASAWDRIEGKLEVAHGKKKRNVVVWMAIAASFIAGMCITALVFSEDTGTIKNEIVTTPSAPVIIEKGRTTLEKPSAEPTTKTAQVVKENKSEVVTTDDNRNSQKPKTLNKSLQPSTKATINVNRNKPQPVFTTTQEAIAITASEHSFSKGGVAVKEDQMEAPQARDAVVTVDPNTVTDAEVDALLKEARIATKRRSIDTPRVLLVDANELLLDAEAEVDPDSFKDRVFRTLKKELSKAVEAVASKDN